MWRRRAGDREMLYCCGGSVRACVWAAGVVVCDCVRVAAGPAGGRRGFSRPTHDIDECQFSVLPTANTSLATAAAADDGWSVTDARYLSMASSHSSVSHPALARSARRPLFSAHVETIFNDPVSQEGTCNKFGCVRPYVRMFAST